MKNFLQNYKMNPVEQKIKSNYSSLTKKQRLISVYIIENMEETAFSHLSLLSKKAKVSEASVTRFCQALGYERYSDFQKELQDWIKARITPLAKIKKFVAEGEKKNIYLQVINSDIANLESLREAVPNRQLNSAVRLITEAKKVYIIGMRTSFGSAVLLEHYLTHIGIPSELLDGQGGRLLDRIIRIGKDDALIGICFPRYFKQSLDVMRYAKTKQSKIIVITGSVLSPVAQGADVVITAKYSTPIPFISYINVLSIINCLVYGVITKRKKQSVDFVSNIEEMLKNWDIIVDE